VRAPPCDKIISTGWEISTEFAAHALSASVAVVLSTADMALQICTRVPQSEEL
jgi:hypothetical protein